ESETSNPEHLEKTANACRSLANYIENNGVALDTLSMAGHLVLPGELQTLKEGADIARFISQAKNLADTADKVKHSRGQDKVKNIDQMSNLAKGTINLLGGASSLAGSAIAGGGLAGAAASAQIAAPIAIVAELPVLFKNIGENWLKPNANAVVFATSFSFLCTAESTEIIDNCDHDHDCVLEKIFEKAGEPVPVFLHDEKARQKSIRVTGKNKSYNVPKKNMYELSKKWSEFNNWLGSISNGIWNFISSLASSFSITGLVTASQSGDLRNENINLGASYIVSSGTGSNNVVVASPTSKDFSPEPRKPGCAYSGNNNDKEQDTTSSAPSFDNNPFRPANLDRQWQGELRKIRIEINAAGEWARGQYHASAPGGTLTSLYSYLPELLSRPFTTSFPSSMETGDIIASTLSLPDSIRDAAARSTPPPPPQSSSPPPSASSGTTVFNRSAAIQAWNTFRLFKSVVSTVNSFDASSGLSGTVNSTGINHTGIWAHEPPGLAGSMYIGHVAMNAVVSSPCNSFQNTRATLNHYLQSRISCYQRGLRYAIFWKNQEGIRQTKNAISTLSNLRAMVNACQVDENYWKPEYVNDPNGWNW
ncbi:MAG: hypothetical protein J7M18_04920, partial [Candidatus Eremiobacteraeota bacterium]|nr:hypothetical protein [Candidatus Eremiobacteraeota bacterium]